MDQHKRKNDSSNNNNNSKDCGSARKKKKRYRRFVQPTDSLASRTRSQIRNQRSKLHLPIPIIINVVDYLTNEEKMDMLLVCKQLMNLVLTGPLQTKFLRILEISPTPESSTHDRVRCFIQMMMLYRTDVNTFNKLQTFGMIKVQELHKFIDGEDYLDSYGEECTSYITDPEEEMAMEQLRLEGIELLDMSVSSETLLYRESTLPSPLSYMVPNLRELNCSYNPMQSPILQEFTNNCPDLEMIHWDGIAIGSYVDVFGKEIEFANNLKELILDESTFIFGRGHRYFLNAEYEDQMTSLDNHPNVFIFHKCKSTVLEKVSIRNANYVKEIEITRAVVLYNQSHWIRETKYKRVSIPQDALIKFVRNAPSSLKWFRSDLTVENIKLLQRERPEIEFVYPKQKWKQTTLDLYYKSK